MKAALFRANAASAAVAAPKRWIDEKNGRG